MTGTSASRLMRSISPLPPRGTMTSTLAFILTSSLTAARSVIPTTCTASTGRLAARRPACTQAAMAWLLCSASEPPRRMAALPALRHKPAASAVTLGRDS